MTTKLRRSGRVLLAFSMMALVLPFAPARAANKISNAGFELSYLPGQAIQAQQTGGVIQRGQPVWPQGWAAEGATELFDHSPWEFNSGKYGAQISGSWGVPRKDCSVQCTTPPGNAQRDQVYGSFVTEAPAWRTDVPIAVAGSTTYSLSYYVKMSIVMDGSGSTSWVRWYDANLLPIIDPVTHVPAYSRGPTHVVSCTPPGSYVKFAQGDPMLDSCHSPSWAFKGGSVTSPPGARFAVVLFGYLDSAWIGSVVFDDVFFG